MGDQLMDHAMKIAPLLIAAGVLAAAPAFAQANTEPTRDPAKTEVWTPVPATVATPPGKAPSDAIVLFDGKDASAWESEQGGRVPWAVADGAMTIVPGSKGIRTRQRFCDIQLHVEWRTPVETKGFDGQNRGNSGIFLQELYELQVLDSYNNPTYANGQAGSIYKQAMPLVNASRAPGQWQAYDILWKAPRFSPGGGLISPARITVLHNGVLVQDDTVLAGRTEYIGPPSYSSHACAPIHLQEHDAKVSYRNIWVREL
ncbi:cycloisomaltooligosaccharide glucanotransferase [Stenotrophomonas maltophilia 5BA-I-2]|uniref:3-keto-disaccharide hydrolase n=1 Tax=Stenotrophomonas indicatrix TaxID=2045451 RepID=UPI0003EA6CC2|nr:cycloisomaltooligosaccharide glucanotransferase [Stenotrophomonas maltophilia 5BA-I-2]